MTQPLSSVVGETTEAATIADLAQRATDPVELDTTKLYSILVPAGSSAQILDLEKHHPHPFRKRGTVNLTTAASLAAYTDKHGEDDGGTELYADQQALRVVAVLNAHAGEPGWGDHRATFQVRHTPEWTHWKSRDGVLGGQVDFAGHIEDGMPEVIEPDGATLLEIAQTFHAKTGVDFKSAIRLDSGERQFRFEEEIKAHAGRTIGTIDIPEIFVLYLAPFEGADAVRVEARLRYRLSNGQLLIGYQLVRPDDVVRDSFEAVVTDIETDTQLTAYRGTPPA